MTKNRRRIFVKGLGGPFEVRETDPSVDAAFLDAGFHESVLVNDVYDMEDIIDGPGNFVDSKARGRKVTGVAELLQTSKVELDLIRNAEGKLYVVRYSGLAATGFWQYLCFEQCGLTPGMDLRFAVGKRTIPLRFNSFNQEDVTSDIPEYYFNETVDEIRVANLLLWTEPRLDYQAGTVRLLDISGFLRRGTISADYATIWTAGTTPARFLRFDGSNDQVSFGNILSMNATEDFLFEAWVRVQGADGTVQEMLGKKADHTTDSDGYALFRDASNLINFKLSDGVASAQVTSTSTLLQNVWKHLAVHIDRNGNGQIYFNGAANGSPVSVAAVADSTSSGDLLMGAIGSAFGQVDIGGVRVYNFGAGGLPSDIATIVARHFTAERAQYGI